MSSLQRRGSVLIVEDEGIVATDIERCLEDAGFDVTAIATSLEDAIAAATQSLPDLVLMDIRIQGATDGIEAADQLHHRFGLPIIYLTAHDDHDTMARAKRTDPMAFLLKPFKPAELTSTVEIALDRSLAEQKMRERERSFLTAMDSIGDAVLTTDAHGSVRFMNRAAEELTGLTQSEALGREAAAVINFVNANGNCEGKLAALLEQPVWKLGGGGEEYAIQSAAGRLRWITMKAAAIEDVNGAAIRVIVLQDITRRKQNEDALRRQAELLDQALEPIFTWRTDGVITFWNRAAQALYGFSSQEAVGRPAAQLLKTVESAGAEPIAVGLPRDRRWSGELLRTTKTGEEIAIECLLVMVEDGHGSAAVLETDRDITVRRRTEIEIRRLNRELERRVHELTSLNEELESFNYSVSHDLRAPLRHIDGYTNILLKQYGTGVADDARRCMERIQAGAQKMGWMVDELLELSRTSRCDLSKQLVELRPVVLDVIEELQSEISNRQIEWRIGDLKTAYCDVTLVRQVFANLISNAVKFSRTRKTALIEVGQAFSGYQTILFVRDNGVGFNMKYADKLFGVFQRLHRRDEFEGTGVGLVTAQRIIHKHGGRIWAEAEPDSGATFHFTLPQAGYSPDCESRQEKGQT